MKLEVFTKRPVLVICVLVALLLFGVGCTAPQALNPKVEIKYAVTGTAESAYVWFIDTTYNNAYSVCDTCQLPWSCSWSTIIVKRSIMLEAFPIGNRDHDTVIVSVYVSGELWVADTSEQDALVWTEWP
jgi:hypothetical protein